MIDLYVINLPERKDRLEKIKENFAQYDNINLIFVEAVKYDPGFIGCTRSFKKCVSIAKQKKLKYIIIVEDDCLPLENFQNRLTNILEYLESNDNWSLFLGAVKKSNRILFTRPFEKEPIYGIKKGHSSHLSIFHSSIYDDVLNYDETKFGSDTFWHNKYYALVTIPFLAHQTDGFSDIGQKYCLSFNNKYDDTERNLLNSLNK
jgi:GR25 family glycosyltransferase involved in LPS biosynthesis